MGATKMKTSIDTIKPITKFPPAGIARAVEQLRNALEHFRRILAPPPLTIVELAMSQYIPQSLYVVTQLGIADLLKGGARKVSQLAATVRVDERSLYRVLRLLASMDVFAETRRGEFKLTRLAATLCTDHPNSVRDVVLMICFPMHWRTCGDLMYSVQTGRSAFEHLYSRPLFGYLAEHEKEGKIYDSAMTGFAALAASALVAYYDFKSTHHLVDVGGGNGHLVTTVLRANPGMRGTLFDMPPVVNRASAFLQANGVSDRCQTVGGSFFDTVPAGGDIYILKSIIHDWDDEAATLILKNCRKVVPPQGKLLLMDIVLPAGNPQCFGMLFDLEMLVTNAGCERTRAEFDKLLRNTGFRLTRVIPTALPLSIVEAEPLQ
jgi:hypothetical protein